MFGHQKKEKFDFLVIIPLKEEFRTFKELIHIKDTRIYNGESYFILEFPKSNYTGIAVICHGSGITRATNITNKALSFFDVRMVINIGIAGGLNEDIKLGDIIVAKYIIEYQANSKVTPIPESDETYQTDSSPEYFKINHVLEQLINNFEFTEEKLFKQMQNVLSEAFKELEIDNNNLNKIVNNRPMYYTGKIASGNTVIAAKPFIDKIKKIDRKIDIVEMEAAGIMHATSERPNPIPTIIIRGISDFADERKKALDNTKEGIFRKYAMHNATQFILFLIWAESFKKSFESITFFTVPYELKLNETQRKIRTVLSQDPYKLKNLDTIYIGARQVILNESNPERFYQCAYSLKNLIVNLINEIEIGEDTENNILEKMKIFVEQVDEIQGPPVDNFVKQWYDIFSYFEKISNRSIELNPKIFSDNLSRLELVISSLSIPIYDIMPELERLMDIQNPSDEDMENVKSIIGTHALYRYFFRNLTNPNWLPLLEKNSYYDEPPEEGEYSIEPIYLFKIVNQKPSDVARIIKKLAYTKHKGVQVTFLNTILRLPMNEVKNLKEEIKSWMNIPFSENFALFAKVQDLINKLFEEDEIELATEISELILSLGRYNTAQNTSGG